MMKRCMMFLITGIAIFLATGTIAYGYWTDRLRVQCEIPIFYQVEIVAGEEGMEQEEGLTDTELIMDLETVAETGQEE